MDGTDRSIAPNGLPKYLIARRTALFQPTERTQIAAEELLQIWPHVTNVWREKNVEQTKDGRLCLRVYCRRAVDASRRRDYPKRGLRKTKYNTRDCRGAIKIWFGRDGTIEIEPRLKHDHGIELMDERGMSAGLVALLRRLLDENGSSKAAVHDLLKREVETNETLDATGARYVTKKRLENIQGQTEESQKAKSVLLRFLTDETKWRTWCNEGAERVQRMDERAAERRAEGDALVSSASTTAGTEDHFLHSSRMPPQASLPPLPPRESNHQQAPYNPPSASAPPQVTLRSWSPSLEACESRTRNHQTPAEGAGSVAQTHARAHQRKTTETASSANPAGMSASALPWILPPRDNGHRAPIAESASAERVQSSLHAEAAAADRMAIDAMLRAELLQDKIP